MLNPEIKLNGYSERGMINAMMYEIQYSDTGIEMLKEFLNLIKFPFATPAPDFNNIQSAKIRIEQSFSEFGTLDLLILVEDGNNNKHSILLEAKVKTIQAKFWLISKQLERFEEIIEGNLKPKSNIFTQLYRKMRLIYKIQNPDIPLRKDVIGDQESLGENKIVKKAVKELEKYSSKAWFVALIPDSIEHLELIFNDINDKSLFFQAKLHYWDKSNLGFLAWEELDNFCKDNSKECPHTLSNFTYNDGQIYSEQSSNIPNEQNSTIENQKKLNKSRKITLEKMLENASSKQKDIIEIIINTWEKCDDKCTLEMGTKGLSLQYDKKYSIFHLFVKNLCIANKSLPKQLTKYKKNIEIWNKLKKNILIVYKENQIVFDKEEITITRIEKTIKEIYDIVSDEIS